MSKARQMDRKKRRQAATTRSANVVSLLVDDDVLRGPLGLAVAIEFYQTNIPFIRAMSRGREQMLHQSFLQLVEAGTIRVTRLGDRLHAELDPIVAAEIEASKAEFAALDGAATDPSADRNNNNRKARRNEL